jgi:hypothetical protein
MPAKLDFDLTFAHKGAETFWIARRAPTQWACHPNQSPINLRDLQLRVEGGFSLLTTSHERFAMNAALRPFERFSA